MHRGTGGIQVYVSISLAACDDSVAASTHTWEASSGCFKATGRENWFTSRACHGFEARRCYTNQLKDALLEGLGFGLSLIVLDGRGPSV